MVEDKDLDCDTRDVIPDGIVESTRESKKAGPVPRVSDPSLSCQTDGTLQLGHVTVRDNVYCTCKADQSTPKSSGAPLKQRELLF